MTYPKKLTLLQQQNDLEDLIGQRLYSEKPEIRQQVYKWLSDNQYFVDNELFDFYFSVAQNIAAVQVLGASGEKIVKAKIELEESVQVYTTQIVDTSNWINEQLQGQLDNIQKNQQQLDKKLIQVLGGLTTENQNLKTVSTGLVNSGTCDNHQARSFNASRTKRNSACSRYRNPPCNNFVEATLVACIMLSRSYKVTVSPACANAQAEHKPLIPPPITAIFFI